jgi:cell division protein ZapA
MAHVIVEVNGRPYTMQCPDGEEDHLRELAKLLDTEVGRIKTSVGSVGDIRLLVMAGLMVADRLSESIRKIEDLDDQVRGLKDTRVAMQEEMRALEQKVTTKLDVASTQLERLARALDGG